MTADQQVTELDDGRVEIAATVHDTLQLRWWLLGFGADAEVIAPASLRNGLRDEVEAMARLYGVEGSGISELTASEA